jgi:hypothetical protein
MEGKPIKAANAAVQLFLRSLPDTVKFNVVGFGSKVDWLFDTSQLVTDQTLEQATSWVGSKGADLGATDLLKPLLDIFSTPPNPNYPRQVFVLTGKANRCIWRSHNCWSNLG